MITHSIGAGDREFKVIHSSSFACEICAKSMQHLASTNHTSTMSPNYKFPSSQKIQMTEIEGRSLRRKKIPLRLDFIDWFLIFLFMVSLVVVISLFEKHVLDPMMPKAEAAVEKYDNAWYCTHIDEYFVPERSTVDDYCADHPELAVLGV